MEMEISTRVLEGPEREERGLVGEPGRDLHEFLHPTIHSSPYIPCIRPEVQCSAMQWIPFPRGLEGIP